MATASRGQINIKQPKSGMNVSARYEVVRKDAYNKYYGMVFYEGVSRKISAPDIEMSERIMANV